MVYLFMIYAVCLLRYCVHSQEISILETSVKGIREKDVSLEWTLKKGKEFRKINIIEIFRGEAAESDDSNLIIRERSPEKYAQKIFGNRLLPADIIGDRAADDKIIYKITLTDLQYSDTGFFFLRAKFENKSFNQKLVNSAVSLKVEGPGEFCFDNSTNESKLTYIICGVPQPKVTWGFNPNGVWTAVRSTVYKGLTYAYEFSLELTSRMCGRRLYFKTNINTDNPTTWNVFPRIKLNSSDHNVQNNRTESETNVWWDDGNFGKCKIKYVVDFFHEDKMIHNEETEAKLVQCRLKCLNATSFKLSIVYGKDKWLVASKDLQKIVKLTATEQTTPTRRKPTTIDTNDRKESKTEKESSMNLKTILAIVCGVLLGCAVAIIIGALFLRKSRTSKEPVYTAELQHYSPRDTKEFIFATNNGKRI